VENEFDLIMGFDTKRDNLFMTANAYKAGVAAWTGADYIVGDVVSLSGVAFYDYPLFFRALQNGANKYPLTNPDYWEQIPLSDGDYYSIFTILFNEKLNTFTSLCGALPNRYFQYNNELLVPNVKSPWGKVYELNNGTDTYFTAVEPTLTGEQITGEYMTFKIVSANDITILDAVAKMYYRPRMPR